MIKDIKNGYSKTITISNLDYRKSYRVSATVKDAIGTVTSESKTFQAIPIFDWGQNDFNFNVPVSIEHNPIADFVIEQGYYGTGWYYRKWNNGTYECWGTIKSSITSIESLFGGNVCHGSISFPTVFIQAPVVNYTIHGNTGYEFAGKGYIGTGSFIWYALSNASYAVGNTVNVHCHVIGKWK